MTRTIKASEPREILALVPYQLGFVPTDSVVLVGLRGPRRRVGIMIRSDLVDLADPEVGPQLARNLVGAAAHDGANGVVVILYAPDLPEEGGPVDRVSEAVLDHLDEALGHALEVVGVLVVGSRTFHAHDGVAAGPGRPLADLEGTAVGAQMVFMGATVAAGRDELGRLPVPPAASLRTASRAARAHLRPEGDPTPWRCSSLAAWRRAVADVTRDTATGRGPRNRPTTWGRLGEALEDRTVRDAVLVTLVPGTGTVAERFCASDGEDGVDEVGLAVRVIADPEVAVAPDAEALAPARDALRHVAAHRDGGSAPALTLLGLLAWWTGHGAEAAVWADRALAVAPGYPLALLVREAIDAGLPPGWVRSARAADG